MVLIDRSRTSTTNDYYPKPTIKCWDWVSVKADILSTLEKWKTSRINQTEQEWSIAA